MASVAVVGRVAVQSAAIHTAADILGQSLERWGIVPRGGGEGDAQNSGVSVSTGASSSNGWDTARTVRFAIVGGTLHGPYFGVGFAYLDRWLGASRSVGNVARKVIATQVRPRSTGAQLLGYSTATPCNCHALASAPPQTRRPRSVTTPSLHD